MVYINGICLILVAQLVSTNGLMIKQTRGIFKTKTRILSQSTGVDASVAPEKKEYSFVRDDLRSYAMKLHTKDQAPKEGEQKAQTPFTKWEPKRADYLQFLVDSLHVFSTFEEIVSETPALAPFKNTGLERSTALKEDIAWFPTYDSSLTIPECGESGLEYSKFLRNLAKESIPKFMCHYYNHYFAHTAGGRMIGKKISDMLLEGKVLKFYEWDGDVKAMIEETKGKIDALAATWTEEEKKQCMEETMASFQYSGSLMVYMKPKEA